MKKKYIIGSFVLTIVIGTIIILNVKKDNGPEVPAQVREEGNILNEIEQQLDIATRSGGTTSDNYNLISAKLAEFEKQGIEPEKTRSLREKLGQLSIGGERTPQKTTGRQQIVTTPTPSTGQTAYRSPIPSPKITQTNSPGLIYNQPQTCEPRLGFDDYRTFESFAIDPQNPAIMYVAIEHKGIYKSSDGGKTWHESAKGILGYPRQNDPTKICYDQHPKIVIDQANPRRLLLTSAPGPGLIKNTPVGGVYESLDGAQSWHGLFTGDMEAWTYQALAIDGKNPGTIYAGVTSMPSSHTGANPNEIFVKTGIIYRTKDSGKTWHELPTGILPNLRADKIFIDNEDSSHLIFTTFALPPNKGGGQTEARQIGIIKSGNSGESWTSLQSFPSDYRGIRFASMSPKKFGHMFVLGASANRGDKAFYSLDGEIFNEVSSSVNLAVYDPHDSSGLHLFGLNLYAEPKNFYESTDGGKTWNPVGNLPAEVNSDNRVSNIVFDPLDKKAIYLNGDRGHIWKSADKGNTWERLLSIDTLPTS